MQVGGEQSLVVWTDHCGEERGPCGHPPKSLPGSSRQGSQNHGITGWKEPQDKSSRLSICFADEEIPRWEGPFPVVTALITLVVGLWASTERLLPVSLQKTHSALNKSLEHGCLLGPQLPLLCAAGKTSPQFPGLASRASPPGHIGHSSRHIFCNFPGIPPPPLQPKVDHACTCGCRNLTAGPASGYLLCLTGLEWSFPCWSPVKLLWPSLPSLL